MAMRIKLVMLTNSAGAIASIVSNRPVRSNCELSAHRGGLLRQRRDRRQDGRDRQRKHAYALHGETSGSGGASGSSCKIVVPDGARTNTQRRAAHVSTHRSACGLSRRVSITWTWLCVRNNVENALALRSSAPPERRAFERQRGAQSERHTKR